MNKPETVLVADDNPHIVKLIQVNLEFHGYETVLAYDGEEALRGIREKKPDLIILDISMPKLDGWEVIERVKKDSATAHLPVIALTAMGKSEDRRKGLELGVSDYITKPFNPARLLEVVEHTLHPEKAAAEPEPERRPAVTRVGIVGGGERAIGILQSLLGNSRVELAGLAVREDEVPASILAGELKVFVTNDPYVLCSLPGVNLVIEAEPNRLDMKKVRKINPDLEVLRSNTTAFIWSLIEEKEMSEERSRSLVTELHGKVKELNTLHTVGNIIGSVIDLEAMFPFVLNLVADLMNAEEAVVFLEGDEGSKPRFARTGMAFGKEFRRKAEKAVFAKNAPVAAVGKEFDLDVSRVVLVPLMAKEKRIGFFALFFTEREGITDTELTFLSTLAAQAAVAIENAQLYQDVTRSKNQIEALLSKLMYAQEEERKRISTEIHDSIAQTLVGALTKVQTCQAMLPESLEKTAEELEDLKKIMVESLREIRQIILNLRPSTLDDLGLISTLEHHLKKFEAETEILSFLFVRIPPKKLPPVLETAVFRLVQEALSNVKKHADATEINVVLQGTDSKLKLKISDNGKGFDAEKLKDPARLGESVGLTGMKERVTMLGGTFRVETLPQKGTQILVEIPLQI